jgi:hypothetical protein
MAGGEMMTEVALYPEFSTPEGEPGEQEVKIFCMVMSRIVGYYSDVYGTWNLGKKEEFKDREMFNLEKSQFVTDSVTK